MPYADLPENLTEEQEAGHMAEIDRPEAVAESILRFLD